MNSKLTYLIYSSLGALLNINVIATLEDNFGSTPWEQTFEFNSKDSGNDDSGNIISPIMTPVNPAIR
ncbi:hypothetical protein [Muribaculum intestinale]|uniref:Uncharacterized protein n=1 Tax=Muribaculum intestinale TaxID=1796646 RepID=A0A4S2FPX0_9BACT|nr:hypothetical protein [Muribaculum intestinale]MYM13289.1 hypothetical protein [Muribaculum intestinale]TGY71166.1 hypothetical protein E5333_11895 [Muribaculum intestinale]